MPQSAGSRAAFSCLLLVLLAAQALAKDAPALAYLKQWQAESGVPGVSAAVSVGDRIVFSGGVGTADLQAGLPQTATTVHNIGSISKVLAVVAVMQLVEQGKVRLDAEIQDYAPWFPRKEKPITVRQLLTHTSGIRHYKDGEFGPADVMSFRHYDSFEESTRYWRDDPLLFAPGTHYLYSSYGVSLMHAVVESASGQAFEQYMKEHIWRPAGMSNTQFDIPARIVTHRGRGYVRNEKTGAFENAPDEDVSYKYASGGILSTDEDLCRFGHALNAGKLLKPATLAEMYRLQLPADLPRFEPDESVLPVGSTQALIFRMGRDSEGRIHARHSGSVKGTRSQYFDFFEDDVVVALHFNAGTGSVDTGEAALALAALFFPSEKPEPGDSKGNRAPRGSGYKYYVAGNAADVQRPTSGLIVLQGGGDDVDENYIRMGAKGGGGDFVVLRASGDDEYNDYILGLCHCDSVATLVLTSRKAASDPFVVETIRNAEALFIAGGDQSNYVRFWKGTPVEDAINFVVAKPAPIGGTSAGMAVLGEFVYSAMGKDSLTSDVALKNPFAPDLTLERDFLVMPVMRNILTDQHLLERNRIGRTVALLARIAHDRWSAAPRAIAADRETAVHVDPATGMAEVFTTPDHPTPYAYFMSTTEPPERCERGRPLTFRAVNVYRIGPGGRFNLTTWQGEGGIAYTLSAEAGVLKSSRGSAY